MNNKYYQSLQDILDSINRIDDFIGIPKIFEKYKKDIYLRQVVERNFEIIGEAIKRLLDIDNQIKITNARKIINARNKISHGYDEIDNEQIWNIVINHLPLLKTEVEILLKA